MSWGKKVLVNKSKRWRQSVGGMPSGVHQMLSANLTAQLTAFYFDGWSPILCIRTGPVTAGSQWSSSRQLKFPLTAANPLPFSFLSSFLSKKFYQFPLSLTQPQHVFLCSLFFDISHFYNFSKGEISLSYLQKGCNFTQWKGFNVRRMWTIVEPSESGSSSYEMSATVDVICDILMGGKITDIFIFLHLWHHM